MAEKKNNKMIYILIIIGVSIFLVNHLISTEGAGLPPSFKDIAGLDNSSQTLPEAGYCIEFGADVEYTTIGAGEDTTPYEYCPLNNFCEISKTSTLTDGKFIYLGNYEEYARQMEDQGYGCIVDYAQHTQRNIDLLPGEKAESAFVCCTYGHEEVKNCEKNICNGRYTGVKDVDGCRIYALPQCYLPTHCQELNGEQICDPEPVGCQISTKDLEGETHFVEINDCKLTATSDCGTEVRYDCDQDEYCVGVYDVPANKFRTSCGGYKG